MLVPGLRNRHPCIDVPQQGTMVAGGEFEQRWDGTGTPGVPLLLLPQQLLLQRREH